MKKIFINAGHDLTDTGAIYNGKRENALTIGLRDKLLPLLPGMNAWAVPDNLSLRKSIEWVNQAASYNDFAFSIHFNANNNNKVRGVETYYTAGNMEEMRLAQIFARHIALALGIPNRGAFPDTRTWVGSLGWLRKLKCDSVLIEVAYMTNKDDMDFYEPQKAALGIRNALDEILGTRDEIAELVEKLNLAQRALIALQELINSLFRSI